MVPPMKTLWFYVEFDKKNQRDKGGALLSILAPLFPWNYA
jgi:hypothetical protein